MDMESETVTFMDAAHTAPIPAGVVRAMATADCMREDRKEAQQHIV